MQAFHNDPKIKQKYIDRVNTHRAADRLAKGETGKNGKGCAVACTLDMVYDHSRYPTELGLPIWLARLEDRIFEGLPHKRAMQWPTEFLEAVNVGADPEKIKIPMLIFICEVARGNTTNELAHKYIDGVLAELRKDVLDIEALKIARIAPRPRYAAADAAADAAYAAAAADAADAAAYAAAAADAADAAAYAAYAAAAADAADAAAYAYVKFADKLLELIRGCVP